MCTAVAYKGKNFCFGRTLDFEFLYPCEVVFSPRHFDFDFRFSGHTDSHYAVLGMAYVSDGYPLYFDAVNETGLCMAGLNFVGNAVYREPEEGKENISSFEFIPYILSRCKSVREARAQLKGVNITNTAFKEALPPSQLHWIIADKDESLVVESVASGVKLYSNPAGVLTNNPPFEYQLENLERYAFLSPRQTQGTEDKEWYSEFTRGTGAVGLPGDFTSRSRFVRAAFLRKFSHTSDTEDVGVNQLFHILSGVAVPEGACITEKNEYDKTLYTCCIDAERRIYHYKSYEGQGIFSVDMRRENPEEAHISRYPFRTDAPVTTLN